VIFPEVPAESLVERVQRSDLVHTALSRLTDRQRDVLELRYGLRSGREHTQEEVATMLGISRVAVSQHEQAARVRLAVFLAEVF
jgi:RNA polymerase sporulation-specific sigma factor